MGKLCIVEGNIGVGKSVLCEQLAEKLNYKLMREPVKENPYLEKFYKEPKRYALEMQFWLMSTRFKMHQEAIEHIWRTGQSVIFDRSIYGDALFCKQNYYDGNIDDLGFQSYLKMRAVMLRFLMVPQITIFLVASPETCKRRVISRARGCEQGITLEYLDGLGRLYRKMIGELSNLGSSVVEIDYGRFLPLDDVIGRVKGFGAPFEMYQKI